MADVDTEGGLLRGMKFRYRDMGDGTYALVVYANNAVVEPVKSIQFDTTEQNLDYSQGQLWWDPDDSTLRLDVGNGTNRVTLQIGQENYIYVRNNTGSDIPNGTACYISGSVGYRPTIALSKADALLTTAVFGVTTQAIPKNEQGFMSTFGLVRGLDTQTPGWNEGDTLYLSETTAGALKNTAPASGYNFPVAKVVRRHPTLGAIYVLPFPMPAFGDIANGNRTEFEYDGTMVAIGNATTWKDENFDALRQLGASAPDLINLDSTDILIAAFDGGSTLEESSAHRELQHDYYEGSDLVFHVHWMPTDANAGNVEWFIEYYIKEGDTTLATGTLSAVQAAPGTAWEEQRLDFTAVDGSSFVIGAQVSIRLYRDPNGASGNDTYGSDAAVTTFGYHYQSDTMGSRQITSK